MVIRQRREDQNDPPSNWSHFPVTRLTDDLYYGWPEGEPNPWFFHWCPARGLWAGHGTWSHDLIDREPLHLEPSLLWSCCNLHGFVRSGQWTPA